jgi:hypothetical protein
LRRVSLMAFWIGWIFVAFGGPCRADISLAGGVEVFSGADLDSYLKTQDGVTYIVFPGTQPWPLVGSGDDYCAMPAAAVGEALRAIQYPIGDLAIQVVILPVPRCRLPESSAEGRVVFLSPGRIEYPVEHIHYIVAHEVGHVVQHLLMPDSREDLWQRFEALRGLDSVDGDAAHAYRPSEIFAEDFRVLFGGDVARCGGAVENHDLVRPEEVPGLREFMLSLVTEWNDRVRIDAYPNPFTADIVLEAFSLGSEGRPLTVTVFDAAGRRLRRLPTPQDGSTYVVWDGRDDDGRVVAPGVYFARIHAGEEVGIRKLIRR